MSALVTIVVPSFLFGLAYVLGRREWKQYRVAEEIGSDLFVYSKGRLARRMTGIAILSALGLTLAAMGFVPPDTPRRAQTYLGVIVGEVFLLIVLPIVDLVETARKARPGQGIRTKAETPSRTRKRPDRPR